MTDEDFVIRIQLVERNREKIWDSFDAKIPENVRGVMGNKTEAPFLVSHQFFERIKVAMTR